MNLLDRSRIERAVFTYDSWLEAHGVRVKRRRDLRRELISSTRLTSTALARP